MKRLYHFEEYKRRNKKRSERALKKRTKKTEEKKERNKYKESILNRQEESSFNKIPYVRSKATKHFDPYRAPENFSLRNNVNEVISYFSSLINAFRRGDSAFIDISNVKEISSDVILYLLSILDMFKERGGVWQVKGNAPKDLKCRELFIESGFYKYVDSKMPSSFDNRKFLSVKSGVSGMLVDGEFAKKVIDFSVYHLNTEKSLITKKIYGTLIACMANTKNHAYTEDDYDRRWWATALYDENNKKVNFTFLDNGMGIPATVRKRLWEPLVQLFKNVDNKLITSALKGEIRTRTNEPWRGKGLPSINEFYQKGIIKNLVIISNRGYVNYETQEARDLNDIFQGTLLSWDFIEKV